MKSKQKDVLKYILVSFLPVSIYAFVLLNTSGNVSFTFHLFFVLVIGFISQAAFRIYVEKNSD
ncbi:hypothetical protein [Alkalibacterium sp. 20]|uniref:hypothetical protein n=1 Tax=Alkalibacterium sp. 20 TaxID=1798803 RepID=UPI0009003562|nr:hypothetical protein [Alkalibacterium sp. 20]OJF97070.1 hypothetical protein AX762_00465 [Alkalibacterium sp. 20]